MSGIGASVKNIARSPRSRTGNEVINPIENDWSSGVDEHFVLIGIQLPGAERVRETRGQARQIVEGLDFGHFIGADCHPLRGEEGVLSSKQPHAK